MNNNPLVSIIIPVYNGSNYLREAIESALAQTYPNVEVIVVNDGSNDKGKTESIAYSFGSKIRYFSKENGGVSSALNYGIRQMKGEWFAWLSHDDLFSPNRIEEDLRTIKSVPDVKITFCNAVIIDGRGNIIQKMVYPFDKVTNPYEALMNGVDLCAMTICKYCFSVCGLFDEKNRTTQDTQMTLTLSNRFNYHLNKKSVVYKREHMERGLHNLRHQHDKDQLYLADFVHNSMRVEDFFPKFRSNLDTISNPRVWMAQLYESFGARNYAKECYNEAFHSEKKVYRKIFIKLSLLSLNSMILKLFIKGIRKIFSLSSILR